MRKTDFTELHEWMKEYTAAGTMFVPEDARDYYEALREDNPDLFPWDAIAYDVFESWEWQKGLAEAMTERGYAMFDQMFYDINYGRYSD